ncbi:MAG: hypothetical protein V1899_02860 [Planctomycetota bacterium]
MSDSRKLVTAIRERQKQVYVSELQVRMAATILACNGIDAAIEFVAKMPNAVMPIEAAEEMWLDDMSHANAEAAT